MTAGALFFVLVIVAILGYGLYALIQYEQTPARWVEARITKVWVEQYGRFPVYYLSAEVDGRTRTYSFDPYDLEKVKAGERVRLQIKGKRVQYVRALADE